MPYLNVPSHATPGYDGIWGIQCDQCGSSSYIFFGKNAGHKTDCTELCGSYRSNQKLYCPECAQGANLKAPTKGYDYYKEYWHDGVPEVHWVVERKGTQHELKWNWVNPTDDSPGVPPHMQMQPAGSQLSPMQPPPPGLHPTTSTAGQMQPASQMQMQVHPTAELQGKLDNMNGQLQQLEANMNGQLQQLRVNMDTYMDCIG